MRAFLRPFKRRRTSSCTMHCAEASRSVRAIMRRTAAFASQSQSRRRRWRRRNSGRRLGPRCLLPRRRRRRLRRRSNRRMQRHRPRDIRHRKHSGGASSAIRVFPRRSHLLCTGGGAESPRPVCPPMRTSAPFAVAHVVEVGRPWWWSLDLSETRRRFGAPQPSLSHWFHSYSCNRSMPSGSCKSLPHHTCRCANLVLAIPQSTTALLSPAPPFASPPSAPARRHHISATLRFRARLAVLPPHPRVVSVPHRPFPPRLSLAWL